MESKEIMLNKDPFLRIWKDNYEENVRLGNFSKPNAKPLIFIANTMPYRNAPVLLVAAGPSLDRNIQKIKENKDKFLIICADVVLFRLMEEGISPDFVVNIDPHESISRFWEDIDTSNLTLVCPTTINPKAIEVWKGKLLFFNQVDVPNTPKGEVLKRLIKPTEGFGSFFNRFFVGATMAQLAQVLRPTKVMLAGYDFGFTDNKAYCDGFLDKKLINLGAPEGTDEWKAGIDFLKEKEIKKELEIKLNASESIWTTRLLAFYKNTFVSLVRALHLNVINSTEGGILRELPMISLQEAINSYCQEPILRKNVFALPKRSRKHGKKR